MDMYKALEGAEYVYRMPYMLSNSSAMLQANKMNTEITRVGIFYFIKDPFFSILHVINLVSIEYCIMRCSKRVNNIIIS